MRTAQAAVVEEAEAAVAVAVVEGAAEAVAPAVEQAAALEQAAQASAGEDLAD